MVDGKHYSDLKTEWQGDIAGAAGATGPAGGDLSGTYPNPTVDAIQGRPILDTAPDIDQVLGWNGSAWGPVTVTGGAGSVPYGRITASSSGTWPVPTGVTRVRITAFSGGGCGGVGRAYGGNAMKYIVVGGSGGGGGAYFRGVLQVSAGEVLTYNLGPFASRPGVDYISASYSWFTSSFTYKNATTAAEANGGSGGSVSLSIGGTNLLFLSGGGGGRGWVVPDGQEGSTVWNSRLPGGLGGVATVYGTRWEPGYEAINGAAGGSSGYVDNFDPYLYNPSAIPGLRGSNSDSAVAGVMPPITSFATTASHFYGTVYLYAAVGGSGGAGGNPLINVPDDEGLPSGTIPKGDGACPGGIQYSYSYPYTYPVGSVDEDAWETYPGYYSTAAGCGGGPSIGKIRIHADSAGIGTGMSAVEVLGRGAPGGPWMLLEWGI
jgi:hypothetical protein